jgi:tetratricopeptide (TPR) repeat protein
MLSSMGDEGADPRGRPTVDGLAQAATSLELEGIAATLPGELPGEDRLSPGTRVGRFVVERHLGSGGMGVVYAARDVDLDRPVALKLLRTGKAGGTPSNERRARLLREARALAKLDHPNVITVYEVGVVDVADAGEQVFVAMELVTGGTLTAWLEERRSWRDVLSIMVSAGRGLAAAHHAGLIHRDFKPDNVLVGQDGRVRVTDFGLAAVAAEAEAPFERPESQDELAQPGALTRTGVVMGTPVYMSPEQHEGRAVDARSDQFAYCVTLFQALHGVRPFSGDTYPELARAVVEGRIDEPERSNLPAWLERVVRRGLDTTPARRHRSMDALLEALERGAGRRRRLLMTGAAVTIIGAVAVGGGLLARGGGGGAVCTDAGRHLAGVWDASRSKRVHDALRRAGVPGVGERWGLVRRQLDDYALAWAAAHTEACRATRVHKEQSEAMLQLRMSCLDDRRSELESAVEQLEAAKPDVLVHAAMLIPASAGLAQCSNSRALSSVVVAPPGQTRQQIADLRARLARAEALRRSGRYEKLLEVSEKLLEETRAVAYEPLLAEVLLLRGLALAEYRNDSALGVFREAANTALAARHDRVAARAWTALVYYAGALAHRYDEAEKAAGLARASLRRLGSARDIEAALENNVAMLVLTRDKYDSALEHLTRAEKLYTQVYGAKSYRVAAVLDNMAIVYTDIKKRKKAMALYERALQIREAALGPNHPDVARTLTNLAGVYTREFRFKESARMLERALRIKEAAYGTDHPALVTTLNNLGNAYQELSRWAEAAELFRRAGWTYLKVSKPRTLHGARMFMYAGFAYFKAGKLDAALDVLDKSLEVLEKHHPKSKRTLPSVLRDMAVVKAAKKDFAGAREAARRAIAIDDGLPKDDPRRAIGLGVLGRVEAAAGNHRVALRLLERAVKLRRKKSRSITTGRDRDVLARLLWPRKSERRRAVELARSAYAIYVFQGPYAVPYRAQLESWFAARGIPAKVEAKTKTPH